VRLEGPEDPRCERAVFPAGELRPVAAAGPGDAQEILSEHARRYGAPRLKRAGSVVDGSPTNRCGARLRAPF